MSQILPKSPLEDFCHVFPSVSGKLIWKMSPIVLGEVLVVFVNTLTVDGKYPVQDCENFLLPIQMNSLKNQKLFPNFLFHFWNIHQMLNILKKGMIVIANVFPKLQIVKILFRPLSRKGCYRTRFDSQHAKVPQILAKFPWERSFHVFHHSHWIWFVKFLP